MKVPVFIFLNLATITAAIKGGNNATFGSFPSIVSLQKTRCENPSNNFSYLHTCSGFIISPNYILTAAHCVNKQNTSAAVLRIVAGITDLTGGNETFIQEAGLDEIIIHPNYTTPYEQFDIMSVNDLAIVKLNRTLNLTDFVKPITLPEEGEELQDYVALDFAGWGDQVCWQYSEPRLQTITFTKIDYDACYNTVLALQWDNDYLVTINESLSLCSGPLTNSTKYTNMKDAGGPLIKDGVAYGLHSWSIKYWMLSFQPGILGPSGIFVKLSSYISWIKENVPDL